MKELNIARAATGIAAGCLLSFSVQASAGACKSIRADLVEIPSTTGCDPGLPSCFLGEVNGNHGIRGVTHFRADSVAAGPSTALPGFISYSGLFEYRTRDGVIRTREQGVTNVQAGQPQSGAVTGYQQISGGTGAFEGATGFFFVSGRNTDDVIQARITGELCAAH